MPLMLELEDEEPPMVASDFTGAVQRPKLKREECRRTKHGPHFSKWKVLVEPRDWEDYSAGKDGAERYRFQNLPGNEGPGVYELGVADPPSGSGRGIKADQIVPVYAGRADNVRRRLQEYGRTGAHLGRSCSGNPSERICKGPGLFEDTLERGYSIVHRWAPTGTKSEALRTERQQLDKYDYAWNKSFNGTRRPDDVLQKPKKISSKPTFSDYADWDGRNLIPQVIKFGRSQPRSVLDGNGITWENTGIWGARTNNGSACRRPPVQGNKRCAAHKGRRI